MLAGVAAALLLILAMPVPAQMRDSSAEWTSQWLRKRPALTRIDVNGNAFISKGGVRHLMQLSPAGLWSRLRLRAKPRLHPTTLVRDKVSIEREYRSLGFWQACATITARPEQDQDHAVLDVSIAEGPRSFWGEVSVTGTYQSLVSRLDRRAFLLKRGTAADSVALVLVAARMQADCANWGHPFSRINAQVTPRQDTIDVRFILDEGPEVRLGSVFIDSTLRTRENVVRREVRLTEGDLFSREQLLERQQDLYATGLFTFVQVTPVYRDTTTRVSPQTADIKARVVERPPSYIGFHIGAGQDPDRDLTLDYAAEWGSRNWLGTGRQWALTAQSGFVVVTEWRVLHHRFSGRYTEPWIFGLRLPTSLTLAYEPGVRSPTQDYRVEKMSGELSVTRRFRRVNRVWSSLVVERVNIYGLPQERQQSLLDEQGITVKRRWKMALERDTRPNLFVPTAGARTRFDFDYVGGILGGASDFYKLDFTWSRYQIISTPTVLASRIRVGWAGLHSGGAFVPTIDRFYLGGANSIRGYSENRVGPVDSLGAPAGGRVIALVNFELRTPLMTKFWFTLFGDAGNNWSSFHDVALGQLLFSLGVGVQYIAPVGPIRLDYARRVLHPDYPASDRLHLSILFAF